VIQSYELCVVPYTQTYICKNSPFFKHAVSVMNLLPTMTRKQKSWWGYGCETCAAFMSASVKHVVLPYLHCIVMWLCKFSFIPHSCWLPDNLVSVVGSSLTEVLLIYNCMITCYGMSLTYTTHTELEVHLPETFMSPIPVITIGMECREVLVMVTAWDFLRNYTLKKGTSWSKLLMFHGK